MKSGTVAALLLAGSVASVAQVGTRLSGPISGVVFDQHARVLRPIVGVPGASYLGLPIATDIDAAAVSADGSFALAVASGRLSVFSSLRDTASSAPVDQAIEAVDRLVWSPDGTVAAVYSTQAARAQVIRDVRTIPAAGPAIDIAGAVTSLAVNSEGDLLAGMEGGVYLMSAGSAPRLIVASGRPASVSIQGSDLYIADSTAGTIVLVRNYASAPAASVFADGLASPVGVQITADGKRLFAATAGDKLLQMFELSSRAAVGRVELDCAPSGLFLLGSRDTWLLNAAGGQDPLYLATGTGDAAAWFVPMGRDE
jgi:hypothetical protein